MTEAEWLGAADSTRLLAHIAPRTSIRRLRLYLCAGFRHVRQQGWFPGQFEPERAAVELTEAWTDGVVERIDVALSQLYRTETLFLIWDEEILRLYLSQGGTQPIRLRPEVGIALLRDIFGNPFRPVSFDVSWRTSTAVAIAKQMYESRDFSAMPILADALQDAGCDNDDILTHCRAADGVHVRGCWVIDLVLGKA